MGAFWPCLGGLGLANGLGSHGILLGTAEAVIDGAAVVPVGKRDHVLRVGDARALDFQDLDNLAPPESEQFHDVVLNVVSVVQPHTTFVEVETDVADLGFAVVACHGLPLPCNAVSSFYALQPNHPFRCGVYG